MNSYFSLSSQVDNAASTAIESTTPPSNTSTQANTIVADTLVINHWDNEAFDNDDFDSDQLDEDESYSWVCAEHFNERLLGTHFLPLSFKCRQVA